jgi:hypothetical protein
VKGTPFFCPKPWDEKTALVFSRTEAVFFQMAAVFFPNALAFSRAAII